MLHWQWRIVHPLQQRPAHLRRGLDAAVPSDRTLITVIEASARGVPRQRFPPFVTVVRQLWDGDPPEVWEAARRLRDAGRSRDWVLDRLVRT
jgi:hypothetical protein